MRKIFVGLCVILVFFLSGCISGDVVPDSENITNPPEYEGFNQSEFEKLEDIDNLPEGYGWTSINSNTALENHIDNLEKNSNFSTEVVIFIQGDIQISSRSKNKVDLERQKAYSKGNIIFSGSETFIKNGHKYIKRNFSDSSAEVYEVENTSGEEYRIFSTGDLQLVMSSMELEIVGENSDEFVYDIRNLKSDNFMGFNKTEIDRTKGFIRIGKDGIIREVEIKMDLRGEAVRVKNSTYMPRQIYFNYNSYDIGKTRVKEPEWFVELREEYSETHWFDDEDIVA